MYDAFAETFARSRNRTWPDLEEVFKYIQNFATFHERGDLWKVLDVGCGSGRLVKFLPKFLSYQGTDLSGKLLDIARREHPNYEFLEQDMSQIWQLSTKFDTIFFVASFHHLLDSSLQREVLLETKKILAPGGIICLLNWNLKNEVNSIKYADGKIRESIYNIPLGGHPRMYYSFSLDELQKMYIDCGYTVFFHGISETNANFLSIISL